MDNQFTVSLKGMDPTIAYYFNWAANALVPFFPGGADQYLRLHKPTIHSVAQNLLAKIKYRPTLLYRGVILREPVTMISPNPGLQYLSFSTDRSVAAHFANINGFGSEIIDITKQLGNYGYIIQYQPALHEILFHYAFLDFLPFTEAFNYIGLDGAGQVEALKKQKEVMILQPTAPFEAIQPQF
ncbi:hypothetical protein [Paraflavitalea sp. CAU 1676]|uniref:hypothetical protein n=1 Tax=Paraflavitalea sp. CAU 1676 TaxID=3032598 RepID=UPI0023DBEAC4|nr:hypothetical protein [Paraflavitalea sp. CAU 1676]MDF2191384.1 hypothetical protein [Paraflavitalea sp. CAU 1676]